MRKLEAIDRALGQLEKLGAYLDPTITARIFWEMFPDDDELPAVAWNERIPPFVCRVYARFPDHFDRSPYFVD